MAFIRLSDTYIDHPKFLALNAAAFRLWHEGMAFCRKHQTDGLITTLEIQGFRYYQPIRAKELCTPHKPGANPLWVAVESGYQVHDYLDWNESKEEQDAKRKADKDRKRRPSDRVPSVLPSGNHVGIRAPSGGIPSGFLSQVKKGSVERKEEIFSDRAGHLMQFLYPAWYSKHRHGAKLRIVGNSLEFQDALSLVKLWDDKRLEQLAQIILTTNDDFIAGTDRGFRIFALKASWADSRLRELEAAS